MSSGLEVFLPNMQKKMLTLIFHYGIIESTSQGNTVHNQISRSGEMADATDSKSVIGNNVWVQVPSPVPKKTCDATNGALRVFFACNGMQT